MSPLVVIVASTLKRAAVLIENGHSPAKALRRATNELIEYEEQHGGEKVEEMRLIDLGLEVKPKVRAL